MRKLAAWLVRSKTLNIENYCNVNPFCFGRCSVAFVATDLTGWREDARRDERQKKLLKIGVSNNSAFGAEVPVLME